MSQQKSHIVYVTRDIERALGMHPGGDYSIIAAKTPYAETIKQQFPDNVSLIENNRGSYPDPLNRPTLSTADLLVNSQVSANMRQNPADIIVFKNTPRIENIIKENGWILLNPKAELADKIENKITQVEWLGELGKKYLPPHQIAPARDLRFEKNPIIIQWAHGHSGEGTILIESHEQLRAVQTKFPERLARATVLIDGPSFTVNAVVAGNNILIGNTSYQITGLSPFTDLAFATVGNDWGIVHSLLTEKETSSIETITLEIGDKLQKDGWRGLFGIDLVKDSETGAIYLIEINARQPASTTFESYLQTDKRSQGIRELTVFEAHLEALRGENIDADLIRIDDGAQIIQRITKNTTAISEFATRSLTQAGYATIVYRNTRYNSDLVRIQSPRGIMEKHNGLNERGEKIVKMISD